MFTLQTDLKFAGIDIKFIHCDDSGGESPFMTHSEKIDITLSLNSYVQELPNAIVKRNKIFKLSISGVEKY
jgi:hypothetical protein